MTVENTLAERGARYGDFSDHALIAQELQDVMHTAVTHDATGAEMPGWVRLSAVQKQALTVIADKIARILSGDPDYRDNWHDIQGYAKLAEDRCVEAGQLELIGGGPHHSRLERQQDEYFCSGCGKRWAVSEDAPVCET